MLKGSAMTPKFLREEAARFRGMAETAEREASKQRLLTMAIDYEAKAKAADESPGPGLDAPIHEAPMPDTPISEAPTKIKVGRKAAGSATA
jgi:hypothetical protein